MTEYWTVTARAGMRRSLHTNRDCRSLAKSENVRPARPGEIEAFEVCGVCKGEVDNQTQDHSYIKALREAGGGGDDRAAGPAVFAVVALLWLIVWGLILL